MEMIKIFAGPVISFLLMVVVGGMISSDKKRREDESKRTIDKLDLLGSKFAEIDKTVAVLNTTMQVFNRDMDKARQDINNWFDRVKALEGSGQRQPQDRTR